MTFAATRLIGRLRRTSAQRLDAAAEAWRARTGRERVLIAVMALVLAAAGTYGIVVDPALHARASVRADIAALDRALAESRNAEAQSISEAGVSEPAAVRLNALAAQAGLEIARLETNGARHAVSLNDAPFTAVAGWIADLEQAPGLTVVELSAERRPTPGVVSADIEIEGRS